jgi:pimeloyl-ACP methyl ester carboxylesterase
MKLEEPKISVRLIAAVTCLAFLAGCATAPQTAGRQYAPAEGILRAARSSQVPVEKRAADYLQVASMTAPLLGTGAQETPACDTYNAACAELTVLLRNSEGGRLWNRPLTLTENNKAYHLRLEPANNAVWAPSYFTSFQLADSIKAKRVKTPNQVDGVGGELVGVRSPTPLDAFTPPQGGITAPVTATLDFHGKGATLALRRPAKQPAATVDGKVRQLAADYSAPLLYYKPAGNEMIMGLMGALMGSKYLSKTGLYFLQPYDPNRIPLIFVHGLISTPQMWLNAINDLQQDPVLRERYQFWIFAYPTGLPVLYTSLRFREALAEVQKLYPNHKDYVLVSHSMGGLLSQLQVTTMTRADWEKTVGEPARNLFASLKPNSLVSKAMTFKANPHIRRIVFICTPHRGAPMAVSTIGEIGIRLISLPSTLVGVVTSEVPSETLKTMNGGRLPNSVTNLQPKSPYIQVLKKLPMQTTYNSIIGNRGKPGPLADSSDGVVPYWSSHLDGAKSECIVPGPHGSCELPQTIAELDRILQLNLKTER